MNDEKDMCKNVIILIKMQFKAISPFSKNNLISTLCISETDLSICLFLCMYFCSIFLGMRIGLTLKGPFPRQDVTN